MNNRFTINTLRAALLIVALAVSFCLSIRLSAQNLSAHVGELKDGYNYWLYTPPHDTVENARKPVIIFLHGASLCGRNIDRVRRYGTIDAIEKGRKLDSYVIAPQNPGGSWNPSKIMRILDLVSHRNDNVDLDRVYVLGMSLGGYGTIDLVATYPKRIAAAIAMCGGGTVRDYSGLNEVPLWIIHGTADRAVSVAESDKVVAAMRTSDKDTPRLTYNRVSGMNHSQPARVFYLPETYEWLFSHNLKDEDRPIAETFDVTPAGLSHAYKDLKSTGSKKSKVSKKSKRKKSKSRSRRGRRRR